jgi:hypothetical protein
MTLLGDALAYHGRGWSVVPVKAGEKRPAERSWNRFQTERATEAELRRWFRNGATVGIGVICGDVSGGLVCRDFDEMAAFEAWAGRFAALARTLPTVATNRGRHVYCLGDMETIRQASPTRGGILTFADGELRGGGLCVLPPSIHPSGKAYRWAVPLPARVPRIDLREAGFLPDSAAPALAQPGPLGEPNLVSVETPPVQQRATEMTDAIVLCLVRGIFRSARLRNPNWTRW